MSVLQKAQQFAEERRKEQTAKQEAARRQREEDEKVLSAITQVNDALLAGLDGVATRYHGRLVIRRMEGGVSKVLTDGGQLVIEITYGVRNNAISQTDNSRDDYTPRRAVLTWQVYSSSSLRPQSESITSDCLSAQDIEGFETRVGTLLSAWL